MGIYTFKFPPGQSTAAGSVNIQKRQSIVPEISAKRAIWAVGGGKGGIGKTILTTNMAVYLSWLNKKVVVIDMDLGGANLHTSLGIGTPKKTLSDLLLGRVENIHDLVQETPIKNLHLISGAQDPVGIANMRHMHKTRLLRKFKEIEADYILLDLGAGTTFNTLDFFLYADRKIVVVTPEPTSIENAYRFMKSAFYRMLRSSTHSPKVRQVIEQAMNERSTRNISTPKDLLHEVTRLSPEDGSLLQEHMKQFYISLVVNQVRVKTEGDIGTSIEMVCERYFGMKVDYMGYLPYDNAVWQSIKRRSPFIVDTPNAMAVTHLEGILRSLIRSQAQ